LGNIRKKLNLGYIKDIICKSEHMEKKRGCGLGYTDEMLPNE